MEIALLKKVLFFPTIATVGGRKDASGRKNIYNEVGGATIDADAKLL